MSASTLRRSTISVFIASCTINQSLMRRTSNPKMHATFYGSRVAHIKKNTCKGFQYILLYLNVLLQFIPYDIQSNAITCLVLAYSKTAPCIVICTEHIKHLVTGKMSN
uniref:Uncharacterized protein n=1 Tax=Pyxicephalus adspersus TaxID=30357 RepID=A0AAV3AQC2_PYXAD|nr:TPA: hypothetical protein GDO54_009040 [Pyxicephalus adspersus]